MFYPKLTHNDPKNFSEWNQKLQGSGPVFLQIISPFGRPVLSLSCAHNVV